MPNENRTRYSSYVKDQVKKRYPLCRTTEDKQTLADELEIGSVPKLYNLASRLGATGRDTQGKKSTVEAHNDERLTLREDPDTLVFSKGDDRYLRAEFGRRTVEEIAYHLHHSETAILYRARQLGKRLPIKYWNAIKVAAWFAVSPEELTGRLAKEGFDIYPLSNPGGDIVLDVVSTTSIARWLSSPKNLKRAIDNKADLFFIRDIQESVQDLADGNTRFDSCNFLSPGHVCQNPYAVSSFGLFCSNNERYKAGEDPRCNVRTLSIDDLRPTD